MYKGTLLTAIVLNADDHLFDVCTCGAIENKEEWFWFLTVLTDCLDGLKSVIMLDRNPDLLYVVLSMFGAENHCYYFGHVWENFVKAVTKHRVRCDASKEFVK